MNRFAAIMCLICSLGMACNDHEGTIIKHVDPDEVWLDYQIWGEEGKENVTVMLQFRSEFDDKATRLLEKPAAIKFDDQEIKPDSSKMTGVYYELVLPLHSFEGKHSIVFTDFDGKEHTEKFSFQPFWLRTEIQTKVSRSGFTLEFEGLDAESYLRVIALDTVFKSNGINDVDTVKDGQLILSEKRLRNLANGPIHLEIFQEQETYLRNGWKGGGRLSITYGLKRDFELVD